MAMNANRAAAISFRRTLSTATKTKNVPSTTTIAETSKKSEKNRGISALFSRLSSLGGRTSVTVEDAINDWSKDGKSVKKTDIIGFVNQLRKYKKYDHCIQLLEWLDKSDKGLSSGEQAVRLDLIAKARGLDSAEKYFESLPESLQNKFTYGALLNCYCKEKMTEKAMNLLEKMKELNFASTPLAYNNIMALHMRVEEPEKVPPLVEEMKEKSIDRDVFTYHFLMNSYASMKDIEKVEGVIEEMEKDGVKRHYSTYANLATIYVKEGLFDKANLTLKEMEKVQGLERKAYYILIGLYTQTSNKLGVGRVWRALKSSFPKLTSTCYFNNLLALHKLGDTDGLLKCFQEWESSCSTYDIRLANVVIDHYLNQNKIKEAEDVREAASEKGGNPNFKTLELFMKFHLKQRQLNSALKYLETAVSRVKDDEWKPNEDVISMFCKCLKDEKDVEGAESLFKSLKKCGSVNSEVYDFLLRTYVAAEKTEPTMRKRMEDDGIVMTPSFKRLLKKVSPVVSNQ